MSLVTGFTFVIRIVKYINEPNFIRFGSQIRKIVSLALSPLNESVIIGRFLVQRQLRANTNRSAEFSFIKKILEKLIHFP